MTNLEKLEALKKFLQDNNVEYTENYLSKSFGINIPLKVEKLNIAVFLSNGDRNIEKTYVFAKSVRKNERVFRTIYNPFFIRESETLDFVLEKMQTCIVKRMMRLQRIWQKQQEQKNKDQ